MAAPFGLTPEDGLNDRIIALIDSRPELEFDAESIMQAMPDAHLKSVRSGLSRLSGSGKIARARRGRYQALKGTLHALAG